MQTVKVLMRRLVTSRLDLHFLHKDPFRSVRMKGGTVVVAIFVKCSGVFQLKMLSLNNYASL